MGDRRAERCRGQHHAGDPGALGAAQQGAQVARIGDAGGHQHEGLHAAAGRAEIFEGHRFDRRGQGHDALGRLGAGLGIEPGAGHGLDRDPQAGGQLLDAIELGRGVLVLGQHDAPDGPAPDAEQLEHGAAPLDLVSPERAQVLGPGPPARLGAAPRPLAPVGRTAGWAHTGSSRTTARQAMPSARPKAPRPSARVALTDTGAPRTAPSRSTMAGV